MQLYTFLTLDEEDLIDVYSIDGDDKMFVFFLNENDAIILYPLDEDQEMEVLYAVEVDNTTSGYILTT